MRQIKAGIGLVVLVLTTTAHSQSDDLPVQITNDIVTSAMNNIGMQNALPENKRDTTYLNPKGTTVQLPEGWTVIAPPNNGIANLGIRGSTDVLLAGMIPLTDARAIVTQLTALPVHGFVLEQTLPIHAVAGKILQRVALLRSADGKTATKVTLAEPLTNGTSVMTVLLTADDLNAPSFAAKLRGMLIVIGQLEAGRTFMRQATQIAAKKK
jgi:hypothetical protein